VAVVFVSSTANSSTSLADTTITLSPAISGDDTLLVVGATWGNLAYVTSVEYGGVPLTPLIGPFSYANSKLDSYYMVSPPEGQSLIVLSCGGCVSVSVANFEGVDQDSPFTVSTSFLNDANPLQYTLVGGAVGEMAYDISGGHRYGSTTGPWTVGAVGQTEGAEHRALLASTNVSGISQSYAAGSDNVDFEWTRQGGYDIGHIAMSIAAVAGAFYEQGLDGLLNLSGILQSNTLWKRVLAGTLVLSGVISDFKLKLSRFLDGTLALAGVIDKKISYFRSHAGTLALSGAIAQLYRIQQYLVTGTLAFSGAVSDMKLFLQRFMAGTIKFSSTVISRFIKFVVATVRMCLKPIAIVRTWLDPDADVEIM